MCALKTIRAADRTEKKEYAILPLNFRNGPAAVFSEKYDELIVYLTNLLDNAVEACEAVTEEENRFIRIYIDTLQNQLYISIMNGMEGIAGRPGGENAMLYEEIGKSFKNSFLLYVYNDLPVHHFHSRGK